MRAPGVAVVCLLAALTGCRHKVAPTVPIPPATTVPLATPAPTAAKIPTVPAPPVPLTPVEVPLKKVKKARKKVAAVLAPPVLPAPAAPAAPASAATAPAALAPAALAPATLGTLTLGEGGSADRQMVKDSIAALEHRLAGLPTELVNQQREQVGKIAHFAEEAERALKGGDADGAQTLAIKGKLLLDELLK